MTSSDLLHTKNLTKNSFRFIRREEFSSLGIDPEDIPIGTFPALKHPSHLPSRFGGNAYGSGLFEIYDHLKGQDIEILQNLSLDDPEKIKEHYKAINQLYKKIGLLIRISRLGKPYYLIPVHLISNTMFHIRAKVEEISKIIKFHRKKYFREQQTIGIVTHQDDLILHELSYRFKEHNFLLIDSFEQLKNMDQVLDLAILTRDIYEIVLLEKFSPIATSKPSKKRIDQYATHLLWKLYNILKPDGELFVIANKYTQKTNQTANIVFKNSEEEKNFVLFSHIFKTRKKYQAIENGLEVNIFDFQNYLNDHYIEQEVLDKLLQGKKLEEMTLAEINALPYFDFPLQYSTLAENQEKTWTRLLSIFFDEIFLKPLIPESVKENWDSRFICRDYEPSYMLIYLGQKKPPQTNAEDVKKDIINSNLYGCPFHLVAGYRDSFAYVIRTLKVLEDLKKNNKKNLPEILLDRLKQPFENRKRRYPGFNEVLKLINKIKTLERIDSYLNPENIEGPETGVLENLDALSLFGFTHQELREIVYIVLGHTPMGRIISGKITEKFLKPVTDKARLLDPQRAINLFRYCRLMTMAELEASRGSDLPPEVVREIFDLYESAVKVVTSQDLVWEHILDERITARGGIRNEVMFKLLKMMNYFEFLDNWSELPKKGPMEKEAAADYDKDKLNRLETVIELVNIVEKFEQTFLTDDPLELPSFYRKLLNIEYHGTARIFSRLNATLVYTLLWITVNIVRGEVINFNPILANLDGEQIAKTLEKIQDETTFIKLQYLDLNFLKELSDQLYENKTAFIAGTGFQLKINSETNALDVNYIDIDEHIKQLGALCNELAGQTLAEVSSETLKTLEMLFANLESFYQSHLVLLKKEKSAPRLPLRQKQWFQKVTHLRELLRKNFLEIVFKAEDIFTDLDVLYRSAPTILNFILPEFMSLEDLDLSGNLYLKSPVTHYILKSTQKFQALVRGERENFQDLLYLHHLAQREFGPLAAGTVGVNEAQIQELEDITRQLKKNRPLFDALVKAFIFQDIGRSPSLRKKYKNQINPADLAQAGAFFIRQEGIARRYGLDKKGEEYLTFLVQHHGLMHHTLRGELSFAALSEILRPGDKELLDALFLFSLIMLSAIREDLVIEDLAHRVFRLRDMCHRIIDGETTFEEQLNRIYLDRGTVFFAMQEHQATGLPSKIGIEAYLESTQKKVMKDHESLIRSGRMIFAMERFFCLRGIRYVGFSDIANFIVKVPLKYIYKKRGFSSIGYPTFEKEIFEAFRLYNTLQNLNESVRHFIFESLSEDGIRIFGFEKVSTYLSYENQIKLLLIALLGCGRAVKSQGGPCYLNFLPMSKIIDRRYEAVNNFLNLLPLERIWDSRQQVNNFFKVKTGILLRKENYPNVLSIDFREKIDIDQKVAYMKTINNLEQLKNYFYYSLRSLRKYPFNTEDYEKILESAYDERMEVITEMMIKKAKEQMEVIIEFKELYALVKNLLDSSYDIGFSEDQKNRLNDLYELRKEDLKKQKLAEISSVLESIQDRQELEDYWNSIKWYLKENRQFIGREFESMVAKKFDEKMREMGEISNPGSI